jgi:cytochrome c-type biogenesis protein CcmH/NrfF
LLRRPRQCNRNWFGAANQKLLLAFFLCFSASMAQDPTSYLTPDVARVGERLACRCGGCRNTVGNCPMLHCHSADPKRQRIHEMKKAGLSDDAVVNTFVREEGVVALSSPPSGSIGGLITWVMPGIALIIGFFIYLRYVRGNQQAPAPLSPADLAAMERFRTQIDRDLEEDQLEPKRKSKRS